MQPKEEIQKPEQKSLSNWTIPNKDGKIIVPTELVPLVNKVTMQIKFLTISNKNENQTICDIVGICQDFFTNTKES